MSPVRDQTRAAVVLAVSLSLAGIIGLWVL